MTLRQWADRVGGSGLNDDRSVRTTTLEEDVIGRYGQVGNYSINYVGGTSATWMTRAAGSIYLVTVVVLTSVCVYLVVLTIPLRLLGSCLVVKRVDDTSCSHQDVNCVQAKKLQ
jgi:hypothetical protein